MKYVKAVSESVVFIWALFVAGFLAGVILIFLEIPVFFGENFMEPEFILGLQNMEIDKRALFFLCLGNRLRAFFLVFLLSYSVINRLVVGGFFFLTGFAAGSLMEILAIRYGAKGLLLYLELVLPHGIFYALGFSLLGHWCIRRRLSYETESNGRIQIKNKMGRVFFSLLVVITGVILESYVNLKIFL